MQSVLLFALARSTSVIPNAWQRANARLLHIKWMWAIPFHKSHKPSALSKNLYSQIAWSIKLNCILRLALDTCARTFPSASSRECAHRPRENGMNRRNTTQIQLHQWNDERGINLERNESADTLGVDCTYKRKALSTVFTIISIYTPYSISFACIWMIWSDHTAQSAQPQRNMIISNAMAFYWRRFHIYFCRTENSSNSWLFTFFSHHFEQYFQVKLMSDTRKMS